MIIDVAAADLEAAEAAFGPFHPTAWYFRNALNEARSAWDRLRAEFGTPALEAALKEAPLTFLVLGGDAASRRDDYRECDANTGQPPGGGPASASASSLSSVSVVLIPIGGRTYRAERVEGTPLAPIQWRLTRLHPPLEDGPYYACRLHDGSTQCDCAEWTYHVADNGDRTHCKHLAALAALGWI